MNVVNGRPTKIDSCKAAAILKAISHHIPYKIAAESNGICERTFYNWLKKGSRDMEDGIVSEFSQFLQSLRKIEAKKIQRYIYLIASNRRGHKGCQWLLEHVFWKYFSSNVAIIDLNYRLDKLEAEFIK